MFPLVLKDDKLFLKIKLDFGRDGEDQVPGASLANSDL